MGLFSIVAIEVSFGVHSEGSVVTILQFNVFTDVLVFDPPLPFQDIVPESPEFAFPILKLWAV